MGKFNISISVRPVPEITMLKLAVILGLFAAALASTLVRPELDGEWASYKQQYSKAYQNEEELMRRLVWETNVHYIQQHNLEADRGVHTFWVGMNEYGDMTTEEFVKTMNGYVMNATRKAGSTFLPPSNVKVPDEVDWRKEGYVTPVKNQGQCGSCWAFSTTGSLEGQTFKKSGKLVSLSEQNLVDCSAREGNKGCKGGLMDNAFRYIEINKGIDTEESYPYQAKTEFCRFKRNDVGATDTGFTDIQHGSEDMLQQALATVGPISAAMDAGHKSFQLYRSGIYSEKQCSPKKLDHGVLPVGYGTNEQGDYWIVKNSWGTRWGMEGYFMLARNKNNMCGLATQASYPKV